MLLGLFFSAFGAGNLPSAQAREGATNTPTIESKTLLEDTFWLGYNDGRWMFPLNQEPSVDLIDQLGNFGIVCGWILDVTTNQLLQIPATPIPATFDSNITVISISWRD